MKRSFAAAAIDVSSLGGRVGEVREEPLLAIALGRAAAPERVVAAREEGVD